MSDDDQNDSPDPGDLRRKLEEANARAAAAEAAANELRAKDVFRDAGLDPANPLHQAVMRGYEGQVETDAVKSYVAELGMTEPSAPPPSPVVSDDEAAAHQRIADASRASGATAPEPDKRQQLEAQIRALPMNADPNLLNRLTKEFAEAGGFKVAPNE